MCQFFSFDVTIDFRVYVVLDLLLMYVQMLNPKKKWDGTNWLFLLLWYNLSAFPSD